MSIRVVIEYNSVFLYRSNWLQIGICFILNDVRMRCKPVNVRYDIVYNNIILYYAVYLYLYTASVFVSICIMHFQ